MNERYTRFIWVDWAKVILIYLMVVAHAFPYAWENHLIYAFHMPAFFILSGYLYHQHSFSRTVKSFGIPILFYSLINFFVNFLYSKFKYGSFDTSDLIIRILVPFWANGIIPEDRMIIVFGGVWFLISLFLSRLLMGDISVFTPVLKYSKIVLVILIVFLSIEPFLFPNNPMVDYKWWRVVPSFPFVLFGYNMRNWLRYENIKPWMLLSMILLFGLFAKQNGYTNILQYNFGVICYFTFFINAINGTIILFWVCNKLNRYKFIEILATGTFLILGLSGTLKFLIDHTLIDLGLKFIVEDKLLYPWLTSLIILFICYYPIKWLMSRCPILLGKA